MRITDLQPIKLEGTLERGIIRFRCPCGAGHSLHIAVHADPYAEIDGVKHWQASGSWPDTITLSPSVDVKRSKQNEAGEWIDDGSCWHGFVTNGDAK